MPVKGPPRTWDHEVARRLRAEGLTFSQIEKRIGVRASTISAALNPNTQANVVRWKQKADAQRVAALSGQLPDTCTRNFCGRAATKILTCGQFRHHIELTGAGTALLASRNETPLCDECYARATR